MKKLTTIIAFVAILTLAGCSNKESKQEVKKEYKQEVLKKEEVKKDEVDQELQLHVKNTMAKFDDIWKRDWKNSFSEANLSVINVGMDNGISEYQVLVTELQDDFYNKNDNLKAYSNNMIQASNYRISAMQIVKDGVANGDLADKMDTIKQTVADADDKLVKAAMSAVKSGYKTGE